MKYRVILKISYTELEFEYDDYDSVQNFIGYMVEGSDDISVRICKIKPEATEA